jgi:hypothetical protein
LGGKYVLQETSGGQYTGATRITGGQINLLVNPHWTSTALRPVPSGTGLLKVHAPQGYLSPPLNWFRGLDLDATMTEKTVSAHAEVIMHMPAKK